MDPRIARTRQSLQQALLALAREESLDAISVADIAARAGVHRSSFYQHYADKETLLADAIDSAVDDAAERSQATTLARGAADVPDEQPEPVGGRSSYREPPRRRLGEGVREMLDYFLTVPVV